MPDLQTFFAGLLEQDGDAAEVGMGSDAELTRENGALSGVADHLHGDNRPFGKVFYQGWRLAETFEQDRPDGLAELAGLFIVRPDWVAEVGFSEVGPDIRSVEAGEFYNWILPGHIEALLLCLAVHREARQNDPMKLVIRRG